MSRPIVAIVGRPNVGKSTLFNRLIGKRKAIVDNQPGVTRDRNYDSVVWNGQHFDLIDTGGFMPESSSQMDLAVREQVEIALDEADVILLLVDARTGITEVDEQMARLLRKTDKDVLVVVNKIDDERDEPEQGQFYNLGLGTPYPVSAMTGRQSGDLLDIVVKHVRKYDFREQDDSAVKLAVIGMENVGKSSLVNTLLEKTRSIVTDIPGTTRDSVDSMLRYKNRDYLLIDTAGLKKKGRLIENVLFYSNLRTMRSLQRADVVLFMVDVKKGMSRQDLVILNEAADQRKGIVLLLNKWDLVEKDHRTQMEYEQRYRERLGILRYIPQIYVSVQNRQRLFKALDLATTVYEERKKRVSTSALNDYLLPVVQNNNPPAVRGKEIKVNYVTQVKANPPVFAFYSNHPKLIGAGYKRFLENKLREKYGFIGVPLLLSFRKK